MDQLTKERGEPVEEKIGGPANLIVFDMRKLIHFQEGGPFVQVLSDIGAARLVLFAFKAEQQLKEHTTSSQILVQARRGRIRFTVGGNSVNLQAGMVLQVEARVSHHAVALTDAAMLVTMIPSPTYHSLERDVFQYLTPLTRSEVVSEQGGES